MPRVISIIVPLFNEENNVRLLYEQIMAVVADLGGDYELICIDDGSSDGTLGLLRELAANDPRLNVISFRRNFGQTAALMAGFDHARGDVIIPMDGDLQNDPRDIPLLLAKLDEGFDVVSGWRCNRKDKALRRNLPSRIANRLISVISGVHLHDYGCTLKAYNRKALEGFRLYGEMHRFIPIYASWLGARVTEMPVRHHPRKFGKSNYGLNRIFKVLFDIMVVKFLEDYQTKPIYVFGFFGMISIFISFLVACYTVYLKVFESISFIQTPLPLLVVMTFMLGILSILLGLIAELLVRVYFESQGKPTYLVGERLNFDND